MQRIEENESRLCLPKPFMDFMTIYYSIIIGYVSINIINFLFRLILTPEEFPISVRIHTALAMATTYLIIVPSYIHHQLSLRKWCYVKNKFGLARFGMDVFLISLYASLARYLSNATSFVFAVLVIYVLYVLWDRLRVEEYKAAGAPKDVVNELRRRMYINFRFYTLVYVLMVLILFIPEATQIILFSLMLVQLWYRYTKMRDYLATPPKCGQSIARDLVP